MFRDMAQQVENRERALQQQVDQLTIAIDMSKRNREVAQITETDYFQRLRERATDLRKKSARKK